MTTASTGGLRHRVEMLLVLANADLRMRYGRGRIRVVKWVLEPFAALGVYLLLVALLLKKGTDATGLSLVCAIVPFQLIVMSTVNALQAVSTRGSILVNMPFPRLLIPLSAVTTESIAFLASLTLVPLMMIIYAVGITPAILWLPVALATTLAVAIAVAYPATVFGIWYPEMVGFAVSLLRAFFFVAPGLVALDQISGTARDILPFNPLTGVFESWRDALLYGRSPAAWQILVPLGTAALILAISVPLYRREAPQLAKLLG